MPVQGGEQLEFTGAHDVGLVRFGMIVAEHVQDPVDDKQRNLVVERACTAR